MTADTDTPKHLDEDTARQKYILSVLAFGSVIVLTFLDITILYESTLRGLRYGGISFLAFTGIILFYILILLLTRRNIIAIPAHLFVGSYFISATYGAYMWGVSMPATLLIFALTIVMTGILLGSKKAFIMSGMISIVILTVGYPESRLKILPSWRLESVTISDLYAYIIILCLVTVVSWLYTKEIKKSLTRARTSEKELEKEKESLEVKVKERTEEIIKIQMEHMKEVHRIAEFGRMSSGLFHDLINPLTTLSLTVKELSKPKSIENAQKYIDNALSASQRMEKFMLSIRKQVKPENDLSECNIAKELDAVLLLLHHKIKSSNIILKRNSNNSNTLLTRPIYIQQILTNLISNAIDSYDGSKNNNKTVTINHYDSGDKIIIEIQDYGNGMDENTKSKLFTPFFTTKLDKGIGIGLATVHHIVTENMKGEIILETKPNIGTNFKVIIPRNQCNKESKD